MTYKTYKDKLKASQARIQELEDELEAVSAKCLEAYKHNSELVADSGKHQEYIDELSKELKVNHQANLIFATHLQTLLTALERAYAQTK